MRFAAFFAVLLLAGCVTTAPQPESSVASRSPTAEASPVPSVEATLSPEDRGPWEGAMGTTDGVPGDHDFHYTVVSGDTGLQIALRFSVEIDQLADEEGHRLGTYPELFVGDEIYFVPALIGDAYDCFYERYIDVSRLRTCRDNYDF